MCPVWDGCLKQYLAYLTNSFGLNDHRQMKLLIFFATSTWIGKTLCFPNEKGAKLHWNVFSLERACLLCFKTDAFRDSREYWITCCKWKHCLFSNLDKIKDASGKIVLKLMYQLMNTNTCITRDQTHTPFKRDVGGVFFYTGVYGVSFQCVVPFTPIQVIIWMNCRINL